MRACVRGMHAHTQVHHIREVHTRSEYPLLSLIAPKDGTEGCGNLGHGLSTTWSHALAKGVRSWAAPLLLGSFVRHIALLDEGLAHLHQRL